MVTENAPFPWRRLSSPLATPGEMADRNQRVMMLEMAGSVHIWEGGRMT